MAGGRRPKAAGKLLNRELSRIDWSTRVLEQAADPLLPLLERVKYCAFFSSQIDEFFAVRVAGLLDQAASGLNVRSDDGRSPKAMLAEIRKRVEEVTARQLKLWTKELCPALAVEGIRVGRVEDCTQDERAELELRFHQDVYPVLTPLAVGPGQPFPYISPLSLSLGVFVRDPESGEERLARVKVPEGLPRFVEVGGRGLFLPLEDVISHFLASLFPQMEISELSVFRLTRDADFEVSDEADDLLEAVQLELRRRRFGDIVRVEISADTSAEMLQRLKRGLAVTDDQVYLVDGMLDLADVMQFAQLDRPELKEDPWVPVTHPRFASGPALMFNEIAKSDILVHHPYDSFATSFEAFVRSAATDPDVIALKATVYRTSDESPLVPALIEAAENGKQSVCLVELKARFDERRNIEWSQALERAGVHVVYGFPNLKIHAKATLVVRREAGGLRRYVHIGTGNYHSVTARLYEDFGLFTADVDTAEDVANLFNYVTGFGRPERFRKLLVAPFNLRERVIEEIRKVTEAAAAKKHARIRLKVNNLSDRAIIDELYAASQAGAKKPGLPLRGARRAGVLRRQRRPPPAQPRPPARGNGARPRRAAPAAPRRGTRSPARGRQGVGAAVRRNLEAPEREEGRPAALRPDGVDALRQATTPGGADLVTVLSTRFRVFQGTGLAKATPSSPAFTDSSPDAPHSTAGSPARMGGR